MDQDLVELDRLQAAYKACVESWIGSIRAEEQLASVHHTVAEVDAWENAHFFAEKKRHAVEAAKQDYEGALRSELFGFK